MSTVWSIVLLAACLQLASCQRMLSHECLRPPKVKVNPLTCCDMPPFFADKDFEACGFRKLDDPPDPSKFNITFAIPEKLDCTRQYCILDTYKLRKGNDVDVEAVGLFLDEWVTTHTEFKGVIKAIKEACLIPNLPIPPSTCPGNTMIACMSSIIFSECPKWKAAPECQTLQNFMTKCKPYFQKV